MSHQPLNPVYFPTQHPQILLGHGVLGLLKEPNHLASPWPLQQTPHFFLSPPPREGLCFGQPPAPLRGLEPGRVTADWKHRTCMCRLGGRDRSIPQCNCVAERLPRSCLCVSPGQLCGGGDGGRVAARPVWYQRCYISVKGWGGKEFLVL